MGADKLPVTKLAPIDSRAALAGHVGHLTREQESALDAFKHKLAQSGYYTSDPKPSHDDVTLTRFLRARKFDVQGAYQQFTSAEDWRRDQGVDAMYDAFDVAEFELARELYPQWTGRRDKAGLPVYVFEVAALEKRKTDAYAKETARLEPRMIALYEHMVQFVLPFCSAVPHAHPETPISGSATIVDVSNVSLMRFWALKGHMQRASVLATARYAETLGAIYLVGAPSFFSTVWGWVKGWFDPGTVEKINILSSATQIQDLSARIPLESIPRKYGGQLDWEFGAPGPALDDEARTTLGLRDGEDVGALLSAPARWVDGKLVLKGQGRSEAELARWRHTGESAENKAAGSAGAATPNGDQKVESEHSPSPSAPPATSSSTTPTFSAISPAPSPLPPSGFDLADTASTPPTVFTTTPRTEATSSPTPASAPTAASTLPPPILGVGHSNAPAAATPASTYTSDSPLVAKATNGGAEPKHDIHVAARENAGAPVKDLAAALEGTTL